MLKTCRPRLLEPDQCCPCAPTEAPRRTLLTFVRAFWGGKFREPKTMPLVNHLSQCLGRGCDEALFSEKKGFSVKRGEAIQ